MVNISIHLNGTKPDVRVATLPTGTATVSLDWPSHDVTLFAPNRKKADLLADAFRKVFADD